MLFNPSQADVRRFFCGVWRKHSLGQLLQPLEAIALDWCLQHPEYATDLADEQTALAAQYPVDGGKSNPFLHLSMHLAIAEQLSIDQPPGIAQAYAQLARRLNGGHEAAHAVLDCLGEMLWRAQRDHQQPDTAAYLQCIERKAR